MAREGAVRGSGVHIALLRGINVGGKNKLPMKDLVALFEAAGCKDVRTYIQSGNVVFRAGAALARRIPKVITAAIMEELGLKIPVVVRTAAELKQVVQANPFLREGADESTLAVAFLADRPTKAGVAALDPDRSPPDAFVVVGREVYLRFPGGGARTKLTNAYFDAKLSTTSTARNWRTTTRLLAMAAE